MVMKIPVRATHYEYAQQCNSYHCPVANALAEALPDATRILVDVQTFRYTRKGIRYMHVLPQIAARALIAFDDDKTITEFDFWLRNPGWVGKRIPTKGTSAYADLLQAKQTELSELDELAEEEKEVRGELEGTAYLYIATATASKNNPRGAKGKVVKVATTIPPARMSYAHREGGLRTFPMNRTKKHEQKGVVDADTPSPAR